MVERLDSTAAAVTVEADEVGDDPERFFARFGRAPAIVRGVLDRYPAIPRLTPADAAPLFAGEQFLAAERATQRNVRVPAEAFFAGLAQGDTRYNVVNHGVVGTPFGAAVPIPPFLRQNWLEDDDGPVSRDSIHQWSQSLIASAAGSYTPIHVDSYGFAGWMLLFSGEKEWWFYPPECQTLLYDPVLKDVFDPRAAGGEHTLRFPFAPLALERQTHGVARAGDLVYFPGGWLHRVATPQASFGVGGCVVNGHLLDLSIREWLVERSNHQHGPVDLRAMVERRADRIRAGSPHSPTGQHDLAAIERALAACDEWQARVGAVEQRS